MKLTVGNLLFFIVTFTVLRSTSGDIKIDAPQKIHENERVKLTCTMDYPKDPTLLEKIGHCSLWWSKPGDNESSKKKILKDDEDVTILVMHGKDQRPESSTLTIPRMRNMWEGRYSCHVWCATVMETGTITLTITPENKIDNILEDKASVIGAIITIFAILVICIASCCCIAVETCKRQNRPRRGSHGNHASDCEDAHLYDSSSTLSSLAPSLNDAPPRYSLVVVSSAHQNGSVNILPSNANQECRNSHLLNAIVEQDNISGLFVIPSPPPNYRQALMDLAEKGIIFNPENLRPPPPAYDELEDVDLNSSTGSHAPDNRT